MYYYFSSSYPAVIKVNGIYYGQITDTVKAVSLDNISSPFIEICSLSFAYKNINIVLDNDFLLSPPENISITDLKGGYLIKAFQNPEKNEFKILAQKKFNDALITVFYDKELKISIESQSDFFGKTLEFYGSNAQISEFFIDNNTLYSVLVQGKKNYLLIYMINDKISEIFSQEIDSFSTEKEFFTIEKLRDIAKHKITINWEFNGNKFIEKNRSIERSEKFNIDKLPLTILPFAFAEDILVKANIENYLSPDIRKNADKIYEYFGNFCGVMPPPVFRTPFELGIIHRKNDRVYYVDYFTFEFQNGKISNIIKSDN